jgi:hypothetical protein
MNYAREGQILQVYGWPVAADNGNFASTFYVIFNSATPTFSSGERHFAIKGKRQVLEYNQ